MPVPVPGGSCLGGWPKFSSQTELNSNPWGTYFRYTYGTLPSFHYPFCVGDLWWFSDDNMNKAGVKYPQEVGRCPSGHKEGEHYHQNNGYQRPQTSYSWHSGPYKAFAAHSWVEVSHQSDPFSDEHHGLWLLYAKGNGIWFNIGKTIVFDDHNSAYNHFGITGTKQNEESAMAAAAQGYDSIQYTLHVNDHENYPCLDEVSNLNGHGGYMNIEILAAKLVGTYACGDANPNNGGLSGVLASGWQASHDCQCDNNQGYLNCAVPGGDAPAPYYYYYYHSKNLEAKEDYPLVHEDDEVDDLGWMDEVHRDGYDLVADEVMV